MGTHAGRKVIAMVIAALVAAVVMPCAAFAQGGGDLTAGALADGLELSAQQSSQYTGKYYTPYAVVKSDGNMYRADGDGNSIGSIWGDTSLDAGDHLDKVEILYVDADVTSLSDLKHSFYSGKSVLNRSVKVSGLDNLQKIVFKLDASGKNACATLPASAFRKLALLDEVVNFDKTQVASIPQYAFNGCVQLTDIALPDTVRTIETCAFQGCKVLGTVKFGSSLTSIGDSAFKGCSLLGAEGFVIDLPARLKQIGKSAFADCECLHTVILRNIDTTVTAGSGVFSNTALKSVYVHTKFLPNYTKNDSTKNWHVYSDKIHGFLEIKSVANATFTGKSQKPAVKVTWMGKSLASKHYSVTYSNNVNAGTGKVTVKGKGDYELNSNGYVTTATRTFTIYQAKQKVTVSVAKKTASSATVKNKAVAVAPVKVTGAKGTVKYAKVSGSKYLKVNSKTGKVTVQKGTKKGDYKITVKVTAGETKNYKTYNKRVTVTVGVK